MFLKISLFLSVTLGMMVNSAFNVWVFMELNLLVFLGYLYLFFNSMKEILLYFMVQAWSSMVLIIFFLFLLNNYLLTLSIIVSTFVLSLKLGAAPLHFWYIQVIQKISWSGVWVLSVWQKILPLIFMSLYKLFFMIYLGLWNCFWSSLLSFKQKKVKKLIGISSIFTLGWIFSVIHYSPIVWLIFFGGYSVNLSFLLFILNVSDILKSKMFIIDLAPESFLNLGLTLLAISGIPPFLGFFLKMMIINFLIYTYYMFSMGLLMSSILLIYAYLNLMFYSMSFFSGPNKLLSKSLSFYCLHLVMLNLLFSILLIEFV